MKVKSILIDVCESSTSHGIPNIIRAKYNSLKIFWSFLFFLSAAACCYLVLKSIRNFFDFEVVTKVTITDDISIEFPTITICSRELFSNYYYGEKYRNDTYYEFKKIHNSTTMPYWFEYYKAYSDENRQKFGLEKFEFIKDCTMNEIYSCREDFISVYDWYYGNCFSYNSGLNSSGQKVPKKKVKTLNGQKLGIELKIYTGSNFRYPYKYPNIKVKIHNSSIDSSSLQTWSGFEAQTGLMTTIIINRLMINRHPHSGCSSHGSDFSDKILNITHDYSRDDCIMKCFEYLLTIKRGCFIKPFFKFNYSKQCPIETIEDVEFNRYNSWLSDSFEEYCAPRCPLECNSIKFSAVFSYEFNNTYYKHYSDKDLAEYDQWKNIFVKDYVYLNIFYESLSTTVITEVPTTEWFDLLSSIGGEMGLFIGISFLSFAEIFEIIFLIIITKFKRNQEVDPSAETNSDQVGRSSENKSNEKNKIRNLFEFILLYKNISKIFIDFNSLKFATCALQSPKIFSQRIASQQSLKFCYKKLLLKELTLNIFTLHPVAHILSYLVT